jgi:dCTP diphosphatase
MLYCLQEICMIDIRALQKEIRAFVKERDWEPYHTPKNLAIALSVEVSELLEIFQWMSGAEQADLADNEKLMAEIKDEIADSMIYLLRFADVLDLDLEQAIKAKIAKNHAKYPVETARGTFVKYSKRPQKGNPPEKAEPENQE